MKEDAFKMEWNIYIHVETDGKPLVKYSSPRCHWFWPQVTCIGYYCEPLCGEDRNGFHGTLRGSEEHISNMLEKCIFSNIPIYGRGVRMIAHNAEYAQNAINAMQYRNERPLTFDVEEMYCLMLHSVDILQIPFHGRFKYPSLREFVEHMSIALKTDFGNVRANITNMLILLKDAFTYISDKKQLS